MLPDTSGNTQGTAAVLMSTYNGEKYIGEQINSILSQLNPNDRLLVRDDGSTDQTVNIIFSFNDNRIKVTQGKNIGFAKSFFWLLCHADNGHSVYMLADQDDIWLPEKIARARSWLGAIRTPRLHCTRLQLVDRNLLPLGLSPALRTSPRFENAVCENIATGCTIALNSAALDLVRQVPYMELVNRDIYYHDWWLYLIVSRFGEVKWDARPSIMYRQHTENSVGMAAGVKRYWLIWKSVKSRSWIRLMLSQLRAFLSLYGRELSDADNRWMRSLCQGRAHRIAWALITDKRLQRQQSLGLFLFRALVVYDFFRGNIDSNALDT